MSILTPQTIKEFLEPYAGYYARQPDDIANTYKLEEDAEAIPFGAAVFYDGDKITLPSENTSATDFAGIAGAETKTNIDYNGASGGVYCAGDTVTVVSRGRIAAKCQKGTPAFRAKVYARRIENPLFPEAIIGGLEAEADGGNTVELINCIWGGKSGKNGVAELIILSLLTSAGGGGGGDIDIPVTIANGGTGATTAQGARDNLDVYNKAEVDEAVAGFVTTAGTGLEKSESTIGIANGGVNTLQLANSGVIFDKLSPSMIRTSINGFQTLPDNVHIVTEKLIADTVEELREGLANFVGNFDTKAELLAYAGELTRNDYAVVQSDETHDYQCWRYVYTGTQWSAQYKVNDTPFTDPQVEAINSGITSAKVAEFEDKQDKITDSTITTVTDNDYLSDTNATSKINKRITLANFWTNWLKSKISSVFFPVGSIWMSTSTTDPATIFGGTWEIVAENRVLWGVSSTTTAGSNLAEQLPNVKGEISGIRIGANSSGVAPTKSGVFDGSSVDNNNWAFQQSPQVLGACLKIDFAANNSNTTYKDNATVRPAAYTVHIWERKTV